MRASSPWWYRLANSSCIVQADQSEMEEDGGKHWTHCAKGRQSQHNDRERVADEDVEPELDMLERHATSVICTGLDNW